MRTQLRSISTNTGFLAQANVEFAPGLTCIIGARGTCKSTLIESIRFLYDHDPERVTRLTQNPSGTNAGMGLIAATLGSGTASATVVDVDATGTAYVLEREIGAETRIFVDGVREHADREVLHQIEIFSQGDLQLIAKPGNDSLRLALIDRPNRVRVTALQTKREDLAKQLGNIGHELRTVHAQITTLSHEVTPLDGFQSQLLRARSTAPSATPELETERKAHEQRQQIIDDLRRLEGDRATMAAEVMAAMGPAREIGEILDRLQGAEHSPTGSLAAALEAVANAVSAIASAASALGTASLAGDIHALAVRFENESERYYRLRQEQQDVNESLKLQQALQKQIEHLTRQARTLEELTSKESALRDQRRQWRIKLEEIDDELFDLRTTEVDAINSLHGDTIHLSLASTAATPEYAEKVFRFLQGSRIRSQEEVAAAIADRIAPSALVDVVESADATRLAELLGRDLGQMTRVVSHLADHPDLYTLESALPSAKLQITMYDNGQPKPVESLSEGQRATALLPIILRDLPYPLLFDQPEDDLDNKFIFRSLIEIVRDLKLRRQIIFVTHNANIPVLGGADRVVVMHMESPTLAASPRTGSVDECKSDILDLLEGGAEAFAAREEQYHELLWVRKQ